jgi:hypothetical protein
MSRLRAVVGPLAIGVSVWCAAGRLTVVTADAATHRAGALARGGSWRPPPCWRS